MKKTLAFVLAVLMLFGVMAGCGTKAFAADKAETREFTDDCGRTVTIPAEVTKIAVSGPLTQIYILPLCPELMVGYANEFSMDASKYINAEFLKLPALGQLYGGRGTMDLEALLAAGPEVVIDVGEQKESTAGDLDALTEQSGIPFVHIDATIETANTAYRRLGELTGCTEKAETLSKWCEDCLENINTIMEKVDKDNARKSILYCLGDKGLNVLADGSFHAETLKLVAENAASLDDVVSSGDGNEVDMEQLILWNPDVIIFAPESVYSEVGADKTWQQLDAIKNSEYYETPFGPYGWLQSPPSVQRYLGLVWLTALLYPDYIDYDLCSTVREYYSLFYGYEMSEEEFAELTANALPQEMEEAA